MSEIKITSPEELAARGFVCDYVNAEMGIAEYSRLDADGTVHMITIQKDLQGLLDQNSEQEADSINRTFGDGKVVASIPMPVFMEKLGEAVAQKDRKFIKRFLNDSNYKKFRTFHGNI